MSYQLYIYIYIYIYIINTYIINIYITYIYIIYTGPVLEIGGMETFLGGTFVEKRAFRWLAPLTHAIFNHF